MRMTDFYILGENGKDGRYFQAPTIIEPIVWLWFDILYALGRSRGMGSVKGASQDEIGRIKRMLDETQALPGPADGPRFAPRRAASPPMTATACKVAPW